MGTVCAPCCTSSADENDVAKGHHAKFDKMIKSNPFLKLADVRSEYVFSHIGRNLLEIYESKVFGGCIYNKIGKKNGGNI